MNFSNASTSTSVHIIFIILKKTPAYTVYYKCHFSGKMFITLPPSPLLNVFKANDDNSTLNCPPPPFPYKKIMDLKTNTKLIRNWYIYILKLKFWVSSMI